MISLRRYFILSALAAGAVIYHAFATRRQFFPATVALSTSKLAVATVGNLSFAMALCMYNLVIKVFLGTLREIELERVKEKLSSAIMETCLALTIFREEFNMSFVGMFTVLTFVKVFHWLVQDRVDYIEVTPSVSRLAHTRIVTFLLVLLSLDVVFLHQTIAAALAHKGHSVQLLFAFEYIILASAAAATFLKYILSMVDAAMEGRWDGKGTYVFYLELMTDMLHLFVYCIFFVIVFTNYGLPLHLIRDLYMTFRNFRNRITDFLRFRQVTARMDRFPDASVDDLARCDGICIICREEMVTAGLNKKLYCGHVFHLHCLRSWLERQQNCPTCRTSVFRPPPTADPVAAAAAAAGNPAEPAAAAALQPAAAANAAALQAATAPPGAAAAEPAAAQDRSQPAAGTAAGGQGHTGGSGIRQRLSHHRARSPRTRGHSNSSSSAAAAAAPDAAAAAAAAMAGAQGIPGFWPNAGTMVWQMPQWYPVTSMATFSNTPLQYAGQQSAVEQAQAQAIAAASMVPMVPAIFPAMSAPFTTMMPPVSAGATPEAAAAAAAMAAAAAALYMPPVVPGLAMMPPAMLPGAAGSAGEQMAAAAAANAAAAAAAAAVMGGAAPPEVMQASFEATQQMLQRQLDYLQTQMNKIRSNEAVSSAQRSGQQQAAGQPGGTGTAAAGSSSAAARTSASASVGISGGATVPEKHVIEEPSAATSAEQQEVPAQSISSSSSHEGTAATKTNTTSGEAPPAGGTELAAAPGDEVFAPEQH